MREQASPTDSSLGGRQSYLQIPAVQLVGLGMVLAAVTFAGIHVFAAETTAERVAAGPLLWAGMALTFGFALAYLVLKVVRLIRVSPIGDDELDWASVHRVTAPERVIRPDAALAVLQALPAGANPLVHQRVVRALLVLNDQRDPYTARHALRQQARRDQQLALRGQAAIRTLAATLLTLGLLGSLIALMAPSAAAGEGGPTTVSILTPSLYAIFGTLLLGLIGLPIRAWEARTLLQVDQFAWETVAPRLAPPRNPDRIAWALDEWQRAIVSSMTASHDSMRETLTNRPSSAGSAGVSGGDASALVMDVSQALQESVAQSRRAIEEMSQRAAEIASGAVNDTLSRIAYLIERMEEAHQQLAQGAESVLRETMQDTRDAVNALYERVSAASLDQITQRVDSAQQNTSNLVNSLLRDNESRMDAVARRIDRMLSRLNERKEETSRLHAFAPAPAPRPERPDDKDPALPARSHEELENEWEGGAAGAPMAAPKPFGDDELEEWDGGSLTGDSHTRADVVLPPELLPPGDDGDESQDAIGRDAADDDPYAVGFDDERS